ncbi:hypothetical protein Tco_1191936, partial [Tanacetum coccineum]
PEEKIDHMETENAQSEGRTREMVDEEKEFMKIDLVLKMQLILTDEQIEGAEEQVEGSEEKMKALKRSLKVLKRKLKVLLGK